MEALCQYHDMIKRKESKMSNDHIVIGWMIFSMFGMILWLSSLTVRIYNLEKKGK